MLKICARYISQTPSKDRGRAHEAPPLAEELSTIGGCWQSEVSFLQRCVLRGMYAAVDSPTHMPIKASKIGLSEYKAHEVEIGICKRGE